MKVKIYNKFHNKETNQLYKMIYYQNKLQNIKIYLNKIQIIILINYNKLVQDQMKYYLIKIKILVLLLIKHQINIIMLLSLNKLIIFHLK